MNRLILIRHSKVEPASPGAFVGSIDLSLSPEGVEAARLMKVEPDRGSFQLLSSPLKRAKETAEILFPGLDVQVDDRLREIDFGRWENRTFDEIRRSDPEEVKIWESAPQEFAFPEGESVPDFISRIEALAADLKQTEKDLIAVTHGGVIRFLICHLLKISYEYHLSFRCDRPSVNVVDLQEGFATLSGLNLDRFSE